MCSEPWNYSEDVAGECPVCGEEVDSDGNAVVGCRYSPVQCENCGSRPCDGSC